MKLKICGITNLADARYCAAAGADYLGFIQYPGSPRYVEPATAKEIIDWMYGPEAVGVFVNASAEAVNEAAEQAGFALVQLHGTEPPELCAAIDKPVIKALRVTGDASADTLRRLMDRYAEHVAYFLLDTHVEGQWGGTGLPFNWELAQTLAKEYAVFLAGGISADNVAQAITQVQPFAVDLSSSVEAAPGQKDFDKLAAFFDAYHGATETEDS